MELKEQTAHLALLTRLVETVEGGVQQYRAEKKADVGWRWIKRLCIAGAAVFMLTMSVAFYGVSFFGLQGSPTKPSVVVIPLRGAIASKGSMSADRVVPLIERACSDALVRGVVLRINSPGGSPTEAGRIADAIDRCPADHPVTAIVESMGASAAYLVAIHAKRIVADRYAMVGSIGAVMTGVDASGVLAKLGIEERTYASGPLKAMGSPMRADTPEQARLAQSLVDGIAHTFAAEVRSARGDRLHAPDDLYTGRVYIAQDALGIGLVDEIGSVETVIARDFAGLEVVTYRPREPLADQMMLQTFARGLAEGVTAEIRDSGAVN